MAFYELIRFDNTLTNWLIYKHPVDEFNNQSKLIVSPGQIAIIVHSGQIEKICEEGSYRINSELLPFLKAFTKAFFGGKNPYPIEIYFVNKRLKLDFLWGTSDPIKLIDPKYEIQINVRARGQLGIKLTNYQYFFQTLVGTLMKGTTLYYDMLQSFFRGKINQIVKKELSSYIISNKITFFEIDMHVDDICKVITEQVKEALQSFGVEVVNLSIESINVPEDEFDQLNEILHKKAEYEHLGDKVYRTTRGYDVLEAGAKNNSAAGTFMGIGIGQDIAGAASTSTIIPPEPKEEKKVEESNTITCPKCKAVIPADSKFCSNCGTKISKVCPKCGHEVDLDDKFCPNCGENLNKE